jgi:perosamine synthetase
MTKLDMIIRLSRPSIGPEELAAVREVLESGMLVQGPRVKSFEDAVAQRLGVEHAVAVTNCTAALQLALMAVGVSSGDLVAVSTYSWPATANAIVLCGATPLFIDIDPRTYNMDPVALKQALERHRVKAVLPVHAFGEVADMPRILEVAREFKTAVVEDAACALGARLEGRAAGTWGIIGCFSFHPRKAVTTGEGGILTTNDGALARRLRILRNHGLDPDAAAPDFVEPGFNMRMTEFQAALGSAQLDRLDGIIADRQRLAGEYHRVLALRGFQVPRAADPDSHVYQSYVPLLPREELDVRDAIVAELRSRGVEVTIGTYHMPLIRYYRERFEYRPGMFPVTDDVACRAISLPIYEGMTGEEQRTVIDMLHEVRQLASLRAPT